MISVLYVDDEPDLCELCRLFLEQDGEFRVTTTTSGKEALESGKIQSADAIVADYQMPEMNGIEFLRRVRAHDRNIPFILFTGRGREEIVIAAINEGADFYLQKGGDPTSQFAELTHKIRIAVERRRAKGALLDSEQRLAGIINFLPDATFAIDRSGSVIMWNRAIEEMTGIRAADILGKGDYEYSIPFYGTRRKILIDLIYESDEMIATRYANIIHEKDSLIAETSLPRPKGEPKILMGKASPIYNQKGEVVGAIESIRDITGLRKAEETALYTRRNWETIFRAIGHPAIVLDRNNHIVDANDAMVRITGKSLEELRNKRCHEVFHSTGTGGPPESCPFQQLGPDWTGGPAESEVEALGKVYHVSCTPVFGPDGALEKVIHIAMDITESRKAQDEVKAAYERLSASEEELRSQYEALARSEQQIRESEAKYRELAEMLPQVVFEVDMEMQVTYANRYALSVFGLTEKDIGAGTNALRFISAADHERIRTNLAKVLRNIPYEDHEYLAVRSDGTSFPALIYSTPVLQGNRPVGLRGIIIDISVLKKTEAELREHKDTLAGIFRIAPVGILLVRNRVIISMNEKVSAITGYSPDELTGRDCRILYRSDQEYDSVWNVRYSKDTRYGFNGVETHWVAKDGAVREILLTGTPVDPADETKPWVVVVLDITGQKKPAG